MNSQIPRRLFLQQSSLAAAGLWLAGCTTSARKIAANEKLNIGVIGTANQANWNLGQIAHQNIVALCDVDDVFLAAARQKYPSAKTYNDFRRLVDQRDIDAILVATPDHTHAVATVAALRSGRHVYCEKPLTHTVSECRIVRELAKRQKVATQMGTQIHADNNYRRVVELIQSGAIGPVHEVHTWVSGGFGNKEMPKTFPPVPASLHYDLWLGPAATRPYSPEYLPFVWRNWWAFGGGTLADLACHHMDLPFWALGLRVPSSIEAEGPPVDPESTPHWLIVRYQFPGSSVAGSGASQPPVKLTWYHGDRKPPQMIEGKIPKWGAGNLFVGENGMLLADYGKHLLLPEADFKDFKRPEPFVKNSIGHHKEWIEACKTDSPTTCNFEYSGALTETVLLGNVAFRAGKKLEWNAKHLRATNCPEADQFIQHRYRKGWAI